VSRKGLRQAGLPEWGVGSITVVEDGRVLLPSTAVLRMFSLLGFPFSLTAVFRLIPAGLCDVVYDFIARNRIRRFGRMQACRLSAPAERHRFL
jgi:predicted DCC family thiol-disulfide oxidoreductase YuxK